MAKGRTLKEVKAEKAYQKKAARKRKRILVLVIEILVLFILLGIGYVMTNADALQNLLGMINV